MKDVEYCTTPEEAADGADVATLRRSYSLHRRVCLYFSFLRRTRGKRILKRILEHCSLESWESLDKPFLFSKSFLR